MSFRSKSGTGTSGIKYTTQNISFPPLTVLFSFKKNDAYGAANSNTLQFWVANSSAGSIFLYINDSAGYGGPPHPVSVYGTWSPGISFGYVNTSFNPSNNKAPYIGEWYDVVFVMDGSATSCRTYGWIGKSGTSEFYFCSPTGGATRPGDVTPINFGSPANFDSAFGAVGGDFQDISIDNIKMWQAALTLEELQIERIQKKLTRTENNLFWIPAIDTDVTAASTNYNSNVKILTTLGTASIIDSGSPSGWGAAPLSINYIPTYYSFGFIIG